MSEPTPEPADQDLEPQPAPTGSVSGSRSPALILAISLAVVFALAAAVLGVVAAGRTGDERESSLRRAAGEVGQAFFTYDYQDPEAHRDRILELATGSFRREYADAFDEGLGELITKVQARSEGFVTDVYISEIDDERGEAVVVADVTRNGTGGERTLRDVYVLLTFVYVDGSWKVDQVTDLNFATQDPTLARQPPRCRYPEPPFVRLLSRGPYEPTPLNPRSEDRHA